MSYTLRILEDKEFDVLPFKHVKDALGCADPKTNTAYVRKVHWGEASKTINLLTIAHEIDELVAKTSPHEEDGIRYKRGKDIFKNIVSPVLGALLAVPTGGLSLLGSAALSGGLQASDVAKGRGEWWSIPLSAAMAGAGAYGGSQLVSGFGAGVNASKAVGGGILGQIASGAQSALGFTPSAATKVAGNIATKAAGQIGAGRGLGLTSGVQSTMAPAFTAPTNTLLSQSAIKPLGVTGGGNTVMKGWGSAADAATSSTSTTGGVFKLSNIFKDTLSNPSKSLGFSLLASSALPTNTAVPNIGEITSKWLTSDAVTRAGQKASEIADTKYLAGTYAPSKETMGLVQTLQGDVDKQYKKRAEDLDKMGLSVNDSWMTSGERLTMLQTLEEEKIQTKQDIEKEMLATDYQNYSQNQYNYVMNQLNVDEQTKRDLLYGELSDVMWRYNVKEQDLLNFRQVAADAGMYLLTNGSK